MVTAKVDSGGGGGLQAKLVGSWVGRDEVANHLQSMGAPIGGWPVTLVHMDHGGTVLVNWWSWRRAVLDVNIETSAAWE